MPHRDVAISRLRLAHGCQRFTSRCDAVPVEGAPRTCLIAHHDIAGGDPDAYDIGDAIMAFWGPAFHRCRSDPWAMAAIR